MLTIIRDWRILKTEQKQLDAFAPIAGNDHREVSSSY